ncbi:Halomucin [Frankliniella fusca]|uniref:Halomucin n=1 Tax=Frankliniella fusca TaxID=407009 RepID=A0AAE1HP68_9NEOP|nr:Halomucin [Frankliniella fusca]
MASKRSQLIKNLALKDDRDLDNFKSDTESSPGPSIGTSDMKFMNDILSRGKLDALEVEKPTDKCLNWLLSQGTALSNPVVSKPPKPVPVRLVDYSPTTASSRVSTESRTPKKSIDTWTARKRQLFALSNCPKDSISSVAPTGLQACKVKQVLFKENLCPNKLAQSGNEIRLASLKDLLVNQGSVGDEPQVSQTSLTTKCSGKKKRQDSTGLVEHQRLPSPDLFSSDEESTGLVEHQRLPSPDLFSSNEETSNLVDDVVKTGPSATSSVNMEKENCVPSSTPRSLSNNPHISQPKLVRESEVKPIARLKQRPHLSPEQKTDSTLISPYQSLRMRLNNGKKGIVQERKNETITPSRGNKNISSNSKNSGNASKKSSKASKNIQAHHSEEELSEDTSDPSEKDSDNSYFITSNSSSSSDSNNNDCPPSEAAVNSPEANGAAEDGISDDDLFADNTPAAETKKARKARNKLLRNSGQEYISAKGKAIPSRVPKPILQCKRLKCADVITEEDAKTICSEYWAQGSYEKRRLYVASRVEDLPKKRCRTRVDNSGVERKMNCKYFLFVNKEKVQVCRATFLNVLSETDAFVRRVVATKTTSGTVHMDKRGRKKPKHQLPSLKKQEVLDDIASYPKYISHYCRKQTASKYLPSHLTLEAMHRNYKKKVEKPVSYWTYRRVFKTLNLKFKQPNKDTCAKCDSYVMKIKICADETEKEKLLKEKELHLRKAESAYSLKRESRKRFEIDESKRVLIFDLEQCLPTPYLKCSEVYYARQLYVFNMTIYDTTTKITTCYMWHEGEAGRGANEISSCLFKHCLDEIPENVKHLRLFSDSCTGQNRNSIVAAMFHALLQEKKTIDVVDHVFLVPGHTRLECDNKHSVIENAKKTVETINVPSEWYELVDIAGRTNLEKFPDGGFRVVQMKDSFYDFSALLLAQGPLVKRLQDEDGNAFHYLKTHWFCYKKSKPFIVSVKSSFSEDALFNTVNFLRNKNQAKSLQLTSHLKKLPGSVVIPKKKKEDLLKLLKFLSTEHHNFYKDLKTSEDIAKDLDPDLLSDSNYESDNE